MSPQLPPAYDDRRHTASIPVYLILTLVTLGVFNLYWNYRQMQACNDLLGRNDHRSRRLRSTLSSRVSLMSSSPWPTGGRLQIASYLTRRTSGSQAI